MDIFEYVTAMVLLVLGIGVTQLLSDVVNAFRRRQTAQLHWIPLTWAAIVFAWQMQFLWAIFELNTLQTTWTGVHFLLLLALALLLFVAGSLVVPRATDETRDALAQFQADGRWALIVLAAYFFLASIVNAVVFEIGYFSLMNLEDPGLGILLLLTGYLRSERGWAAATVVMALLSAISIISLSPTAY